MCIGVTDVLPEALIRQFIFLLSIIFLFDFFCLQLRSHV